MWNTDKKSFPLENTKKLNSYSSLLSEGMQKSWNFRWVMDRSIKPLNLILYEIRIEQNKLNINMMYNSYSQKKSVDIYCDYSKLSITTLLEFWIRSKILLISQ